MHLCLPASTFALIYHMKPILVDFILYTEVAAHAIAHLLACPDALQMVQLRP